MPKVKDYYNKIDTIAPFKTAYQWDNVGLLLGDMEMEVSRVILALDVTDKIVEYAISTKSNLIISHHPILMQGVKNITQKKLLRLIENKIALICAHTNLDVSKIGVNYVLADMLSLQDIQPLNMYTDIGQYQITVYIPEDHLNKVMLSMHNAGAGIIGDYSHCATYFDTKGQYKPLEGSNPFIGSKNKLEQVNEIKLEVLCEEMYLSNVLKAMHDSHPYETPAYYVIKLNQLSPNYGIGCFGNLTNEIKLIDFATFVKQKLNAPYVKLWRENSTNETLIKRVAVCGGSGNSVVSFAKQKADVYVTGDFTYHQFLESPIPVIDAGHYYTENPGLHKLKDYISDMGADIVCLPEEEHDIRKITIV